MRVTSARGILPTPGVGLLFTETTEHSRPAVSPRRTRRALMAGAAGTQDVRGGRIVGARGFGPWWRDTSGGARGRFFTAFRVTIGVALPFQLHFQSPASAGARRYHAERTPLHFARCTCLSHGTTWGLVGNHGAVVVGTLVMALIATLIVRWVVPHALRPAVSRQMSNRPRGSRSAARRHAVQRHRADRRSSSSSCWRCSRSCPEFGFDIRALLAGVGITGVAIGLGAQSLVRDTINGIFILTENQYARWRRW